MIDSNLLKGLPSETLVTLLPGFIQVVYNKGVIRRYKKGEILHSAGKKLDKLFILIDGDVALIDTSRDLTTPFGFLEKGRSFALSSLLKDKQVDYSARFEETTRVIEINRVDFMNFLNENPNQLKYLKIVSTSPAARNFKLFLSEYNLQSDKIITVISQLVQVEDPSISNLNELLKNNLLFFNDGEVIVKFPKKEYLSKKLSEGAWIGGEALVPPSTVSYNINKSSSRRILSLQHELVRFAIESEVILEKLYNEPFINLLGILDDYYIDNKSEKIDDSGLNVQLFRKNFPAVSSEKLLNSSSDFESLIICCINVCNLLQKEYNFSLIEAHFTKNRVNLSLLSIANILEQMGLAARPFRSKEINAETPIVGFIENRMLLIYGYDSTYAYFHDSEHGFGKIKLLDPRFSYIEMIEVTDYDQERSEDKKQKELLTKYKMEKKRTKSQTYTRNLIFKRRNLLLKVIGLSIVTFLIGLATPYISGKIVDEVIALKDFRSLYSYGFGLFIAYAFLTGLGYLKGLLLAEFSYLFDYAYSSIFYRKLMDLKQKFFDHINVGYVFARLAELDTIRTFFSTTTLETAINLVVSLVYCAILFSYGWVVAIVPVCMFVVIFVIQYFFKKHIRKIHLKLFEVSSSTNSLVSETISSMITIKSFKAERFFSGKLDEWFLRSINLTKKLSNSQTTFQSVLGLITKATPIIIVWVSVLQAFKGKMSLGEIYAVSLYLGRVIGPLNQIVTFFVSLEEVKISFQKLDDIFEEDSEENKDMRLTTLPIELKGLIRFDRVKFKFDEDGPWILDDISFSIFPKQKIALVGESGCGKTTLANLLAGNYQPTQGRIFYDGMDQEYLSLASLRSQIGFIQQDNKLFSGTIGSNITFSNNFTIDSKLHEISKSAYCDEFISVFPTNYDQYLSEGGMGLSGGQKQRLCIARTLYQDPKILILDEATSSLDADSEYKIIQTLKISMMDKTSIIIAHRYSTIRNCDYIIVLDNGKIVEMGTHDELLNKEGGKFFDLFKAQIINQ